ASATRSSSASTSRPGRPRSTARRRRCRGRCARSPRASRAGASGPRRSPPFTACRKRRSRSPFRLSAGPSPPSGSTARRSRARGSPDLTARVARSPLSAGPSPATGSGSRTRAAPSDPSGAWAEGPSLMDGYLDQPEATARVMRDGWLDTGDLGFLHEGELFLTGRAKDVVILRGRNYAPEEIERALDGVPGVRTGCAVAVSHLPEGGDGEVLLLLVETRRGITAAEEMSLPRAASEAVLGALGLPVGETVVLAPGTLPRTSSGKLRRSEALRLHLAGELAPPDRVTPLHLAGAMARSGLAYARLRLRKKVRAHG